MIKEDLVRNVCFVVLAALLLLPGGCATLGQQAPTPTSTTSTSIMHRNATALPTTFEEAFAASVIERHAGMPLPDEQDRFFATSGRCTTCHIGIYDAAGQNVSMGEAWRSSMMANSSRDPYWQAAVRKEVMSNPQYQAAIEDKCSTCHTSMARATVAVEGAQGSLLDGGFLAAEHELHTLAFDGVSCTMCHQITDEKLGEPESFSGHFTIDTSNPVYPEQSFGPPETIRQVFGPSQLSSEMVEHMKAGSTYEPVQSTHIQESELCASCHTLHTDFIKTDGELVPDSQFPEQMPYLEWQHSDYRETDTCQDCHMPLAAGEVLFAATAEEPRAGLNQHTFVGGNIYVLEIFRRFGDELDATASSYHFAEKIQQTLDQLHNDTATIALEQMSITDAEMHLNVAVTNMVGHKLPSAYPSRRSWVHMRITDAHDQVIFESGAVEQNGFIIGNDNDADPTRYEPHYDTITSADQVQIYEAIMADSDGVVTTGLLNATTYPKDNRLLPAGFDKYTAPGDIAVQGKAMYDESFIGGGDSLEYIIDVAGAPQPLTIVADLYYQPVSYRWAENYRPYDEAPEIARFLRYYEAIPNLPVVLDSTTLIVGGEEMAPGVPVAP
jgi:hypothetical protein